MIARSDERTNNGSNEVLRPHLRRLRFRRFEVELALALLIEKAIASGPATAYMYPVAGHEYDRSWSKVFRCRRVRSCVPNTADYHVLHLAAVRVQWIVSSGRNLAHLSVRSRLWVAREKRELHPWSFRQ